MQDVESNKKLARRFIDAVSDGDVDAMMNCLHEEGAIETMGRALISGVNDKKTVRALAQHVQDAFPPEHVTEILCGAQRRTAGQQSWNA
jgi:ketosteroid isomerase-like protein